MSPRAKKPEPSKRGRGRPPIDPDYDTVYLPRIAVGRSHFCELMMLRAEQKGKSPHTLADVVRWLIEESAARRS